MFWILLITLPYLIGINILIAPLLFALKKRGLVKWYQFTFSGFALSVVLGILYAQLISQGATGYIELGLWLGVLGGVSGYLWWYLLVCKIGVVTTNET